jgi:hypothetical protein
MRGLPACVSISARTDHEIKEGRFPSRTGGLPPSPTLRRARGDRLSLRKARLNQKSLKNVQGTVMMNLTPRFFRFGALCVLLTVVTTLIVHWVPDLWANVTTFEQRLELRLNQIYIARHWAVILHCLLVVVSMFALGVTKLRAAPALVTFGFLSYVFFAFTEILRTSLSLFAMNRSWRAGYMAATDEDTRDALRATIGAFPGINDALFFIFFLGFTLGTLCYGIPGLIDTFSGQPLLGRYFEWVGYYFLPLARLFVGVWFWKNADRLAIEINARAGG